MTLLIREVRDAAVEALRKAHRDGVLMSKQLPTRWLEDEEIARVCSCVIIDRAFNELIYEEMKDGDWVVGESLMKPSSEKAAELTESDRRAWGLPEGTKVPLTYENEYDDVYNRLRALGFNADLIWRSNDQPNVTFAHVADVVALMPVVDEAESITMETADSLV